MNEQGKLEVVLTGYIRFKLTRLWRNMGKPGDKEEFIKKACKQKGILYIPPTPLEKRI